MQFSRFVEYMLIDEVGESLVFSSMYYIDRTSTIIRKIFVFTLDK